MVGFELLLESGRAAQDPGEQVVEVVGDAAGEAAEAFGALGLQQAGLALAQRAGDAGALDGVRHRPAQLRRRGLALDQEVGGAEAQRLGVLPAFAVLGEQHDRRVAARLDGLPQHVEAAGVAERHVDQVGVVAAARRVAQRLGRRRHPVDHDLGVLRVAEHRLGLDGLGLVVLGEEYAHRGHGNQPPS